jgi:hypothetical protein
VTTFEEQLRGGTRYPNRNVDVTVQVSSDLSAYQYRVVTIDGSLNVGLAASASDHTMVGVLQNAPSFGDAVIRCVGITNVYFAETVAIYDLLQTSFTAGKEGYAAVWTPHRDGHVHGADLGPLVHVIYVVDMFGAAVTGLVNADFTKTLEYNSSGTTFASSGETVTVAEISAGQYVVSFTPTHNAKMYRLRLTGTVSGPAEKAIITPSEFQEVVQGTMAPPSDASTLTVLGQALESGSSGDVGLMVLRPQIF